MPTKVHLVKAMVFPIVMYGCKSWTLKESWAPKNWCLWTVVLEKTLESPLNCREIQPVHPKGNTLWKNWCWSWNSNTLATWCKELPHLKRPWCWERLKVEGEGDDRGWDGWMASLTQQTWVWVNSRSWWWTGRPGMLQLMRSQRVGHNWVSELNWSRFSHFHLFATLPTLTCKASLSIGFSKQDHWSGLPFPSPGHLPDRGIELTSLLSPVGGFFTTRVTWAAPPSPKIHTGVGS